eukprot:5708756-Prymnesium_polylepis.1
MSELEFPELHDESVSTMAFLRACQRLLSTCGISDFTLTDLTKPEYKRLRRNISAVINFAKFREERLTRYVEFTQETDALAANKVALEQENERLLTEVSPLALPLRPAGGARFSRFCGLHTAAAHAEPCARP